MSVFVGLDCGGSSSRVLAVDDTGNVLFQGQSGAANLISTPEHRIRRNLANATKGCPRPSHVCGCFAGLISADRRTVGIRYLSELFPAATIRAEPDYTAALYASPDSTDICVIAGTGSLVSSKKDGQIKKSGGRGYLLGDYGSGFYYGRDALLHFLGDPALASNELRGEVERLFGATDEVSIITAVYRNSPPSTLLAKLLKALGADARRGEEYALESIRRNTALLVDVIERHIMDHFDGQESIGLSLAGGVWKAGPNFQVELERQLAARMTTRTFHVARIVKPPIYGAVALAKELKDGH